MYVLEGALEVGPERTPVARGHLAVLGEGAFADYRSGRLTEG